MKCRHCGKEIIAGDDFCLNCGTILSNEERIALSQEDGGEIKPAGYKFSLPVDEDEKAEEKAQPVAAQTDYKAYTEDENDEPVEIITVEEEVAQEVEPAADEAQTEGFDAQKVIGFIDEEYGKGASDEAEAEAAADEPVANEAEVQEEVEAAEEEQADAAEEVAEKQAEISIQQPQADAFEDISSGTPIEDEEEAADTQEDVADESFTDIYSAVVASQEEVAEQPVKAEDSTAAEETEVDDTPVLEKRIKKRKLTKAVATVAAVLVVVCACAFGANELIKRGVFSGTETTTDEDASLQGVVASTDEATTEEETSGEAASAESTAEETSEPTTEEAADTTEATTEENTEVTTTEPSTAPTTTAPSTTAPSTTAPTTTKPSTQATTAPTTTRPTTTRPATQATTENIGVYVPPGEVAPDIVADGEPIVRTSASTALRAGPSADAYRVSTVPASASLLIKGYNSSKTWLYVYYNGSYIFGWVPASAVSGGGSNSNVVEPSSYNSTETVKYVSSNGLNMRVGPSTEHALVTTLAKGSSVKVLSTSNGWAYVNYNGTKGWVSAQYLSDTNS